MRASSREFEYIDDKHILYAGKKYSLYCGPKLQGPRFSFSSDSSYFPESLKDIPRPPQELHLIGNPECLHGPCLAIIGARKATPYGLACVDHFGTMAAEAGLVIVSGGAYGCDSQAHKAALSVGAKTVVFMGGGCDQVYPQANFSLFQDIIDAGGAVVSEKPWDFPALPYTFVERNRLIAGSSKAVLIVEAGLPSGTFLTADDALASSRDVLVVPSAITSKTSAGSNRLLYQGATPVVDDESFSDIMFGLYGVLKREQDSLKRLETQDVLLRALQAEPLRLEDILTRVAVPASLAKDADTWLRTHLIELETEGLIARFPDGRYGPAQI